MKKSDGKTIREVVCVVPLKKVDIELNGSFLAIFNAIERILMEETSWRWRFDNKWLLHQSQEIGKHCQVVANFCVRLSHFENGMYVVASSSIRLFRAVRLQVEAFLIWSINGRV